MARKGLYTRVVFMVLICLVFVFAGFGCQPTVSEELREDETMGDQPQAKVNEADAEEVEVDVEVEVESEESDDHWDIRELSIQEEWNDLKVEILAVGLGKNLEAREGEEQDAVALKFRIENTRTDGDGELITYPDQAILITSTGEQLDADMFHSDRLGGDIYEGVIKDGSVIWFLERANVDKLEWVRVMFNARDDNLDWDDDLRRTEFDIRIYLE